jgi:hypothetical protein
MRRILAVAVCGLSLGACTGSDLLRFETRPSQVTLRIESEPPGADARIGGATCKTPCALPVTATTGQVNVAYSLQGYESVAVPVQVLPSLDGGVRLDPNPVLVELDALPARAVRRAPPKQPAARKPAARRTAPAPATPEAAPAPAATPAPAPAAAPSPWPPAPGQPPAQQ